jgi:hypothetical protein
MASLMLRDGAIAKRCAPEKALAWATQTGDARLLLGWTVATSQVSDVGPKTPLAQARVYEIARTLQRNKQSFR